MIDNPVRVIRLLVLAGAAVALVAVSSGSIVLAGGAAKVSSPAVVATTTPVAATSAPAASTSAPLAKSSAPAAAEDNPFDAAVQALVADGTIDQHQADVLHQDIDAGSIDPQQLIDGGVLTAAQMDVVNARLVAIKMSLASGPDTDKQAASSDTKAAKSDAARADEAAAHAAFDAAVQALVTDGTINQHQADVLREGIDAGSIDEQQLVDSGVLTAAQMKTVQERLGAVKQSFASGASNAASATPKDPSKTK